MLPSEDREFLARRFPGFSDRAEDQMWCVVLPGFRLPEGLTEPASDLLIRLAPGYPDIAPDMWWFCPAVLRIDGRTIPQADVHEQYLNRTWQRWSRHLQPGIWRPGIDTIESYLAIVHRELRSAAA